MEAIKKFFLMLWFRLKLKLPTFFIWFRAIAFVTAAIGTLIMTKYPYMDFPVIVLHKGEEYQKIFYLSELMAGFGSGIAFGVSFIVENFHKYLTLLQSKGVDIGKEKTL